MRCTANTRLFPRFGFLRGRKYPMTLRLLNIDDIDRLDTSGRPQSCWA